MKISIITVVLNNEMHIKGCIESVNSQTFKNIEHIIIDGKSKDRTLDIINENMNESIKLFSGEDSGIYDAMNRGVNSATGDIVGFLNSDDLFFNNNSVRKIADAFEKFNTDSCYADIVYVDRNDTSRVLRKWISREFNIKRLEKGWHPPHPAFYVKKDILLKYGPFDLKYKIASDYALMVKLLFREKISTHYIPQTVVKMRTGGKSNRSLSNILIANYESYQAWKDMGTEISPLIMIRKPFQKLRQYSPDFLYPPLKRSLDVLLALFGLILSFPLWILIAVLVKSEDGGPVFYSQKRVGLNGKLFTTYKFRSMITESDRIYGNLQAVENDKRITSIGRLLRKTAMDELPQLLSILRGDMSFVGPRALLPEETEKNSKNKSIAEIEGYSERHSVKPGLTGIAQIYAPRDIDRKNKFRYDVMYIKRKNIFLDIKLILLSFWITFKGTWESRERKF